VSKRKWRSKDTRRLVLQIEAAGGTVEFTERGHIIVRGPGGTATIPSNPGNIKAPAITRAILKREAGIELPRVGNAGPRGSGYHYRDHDVPKLARQGGTITRWKDWEDFGFITADDDGEDGGTFFLSRFHLNEYQLARLGEGIRVVFTADSEPWPGTKYRQVRSLRVVSDAA
jgi:hypothetical protein